MTKRIEWLNIECLTPERFVETLPPPEQNSLEFTDTLLRLKSLKSQVALEFPSDHQIQILCQLMKTRRALVLGSGGTGKSLVLRWLRALISSGKSESESDEEGNTKTLASTGTASLNVEGQTIERFFRFGDKRQLTTFQYNRLQKEVKPIQTFIFDEVSMISFQTFALIDMTLRKITNCPEPFGNKQIFIFGDFFQLPPIVKNDKNRSQDCKKETPRYLFESPRFAYWDFAIFNLNRIHRQNVRAALQQPHSLVHLLYHLRENGEFTPEDKKWIQHRTLNVSELHSEEILCSHLFLVNTNQEVKEINAAISKALKKRLGFQPLTDEKEDRRRCLEILYLPKFSFIRKGRSSKENALNESSFLHDFDLTDKNDDPTTAFLNPYKGVQILVGTTVSFAKNLYKTVRGKRKCLYSNGRMAKVIHVDSNSIDLELFPPYPSHCPTGQLHFTGWKLNFPDYNLQVEVFPFVMANAMTVYRAQGLTLPVKAVLKLSNDASLIYTALSRFPDENLISFFPRQKPFSKFVFKCAAFVAEENEKLFKKEIRTSLHYILQSPFCPQGA